MFIFKFGIILVIGIASTSLCLCAPLQNSYGTRNDLLQDQKLIKQQRFSNRESKKDIFISRGWGAGGMPFSVLYMNPSFSSSKAPATVETNYNHRSLQQHHPSKGQHQHNKTLPQVRTSMRQKNMNRSPHSVIPQLFVSYGWGPLGKK